MAMSILLSKVIDPLSGMAPDYATCLFAEGIYSVKVAPHLRVICYYSTPIVRLLESSILTLGFSKRVL
jgi:hypothetical protein